MVFSRLSNLSKYVDSDVLKYIEVFLGQAAEEMPEGVYPLWGEKVFARVMSYHTNMPEYCQIEAHDRYIDIQSTIIGAEGISVYNRKELKEKSPYREEEDVVFFKTEKAGAIAHTVNLPGYFTMLFPEDAHRPQEKACGFDQVKKFVIKVAI